MDLKDVLTRKLWKLPVWAWALLALAAVGGNLTNQGEEADSALPAPTVAEAEEPTSTPDTLAENEQQLEGATDESTPKTESSGSVGEPEIPSNEVAATEPEPIEPRVQPQAESDETCTTEYGDFVTSKTCELAIARGRSMSVEYGLATSADTPAAELGFWSLCHTLQGDIEHTTTTPSNIEFINALNDSDVCPGDPSLLVLVPG